MSAMLSMVQEDRERMWAAAAELLGNPQEYFSLRLRSSYVGFSGTQVLLAPLFSLLHADFHMYTRGPAFDESLFFSFSF